METASNNIAHPRSLIFLFTTMAMHDVNRRLMASEQHGETLPARTSDRRLVMRPCLSPRVRRLFPPLCVDLDGTLVRSDTLLEGLIALLGGMHVAAVIGVVLYSVVRPA